MSSAHRRKLSVKAVLRNGELGPERLVASLFPLSEYPVAGQGPGSVDRAKPIFEQWARSAKPNIALVLMRCGRVDVRTHVFDEGSPFALGESLQLVVHGEDFSRDRKQEVMATSIAPGRAIDPRAGMEPIGRPIDQAPKALGKLPLLGRRPFAGSRDLRKSVCFGADLVKNLLPGGLGLVGYRGPALFAASAALRGRLGSFVQVERVLFDDLSVHHVVATLVVFRAGVVSRILGRSAFGVGDQVADPNGHRQQNKAP